MKNTINYLTARPMLEYLLALDGFEMETVSPEEALPIFSSFLALDQDPRMANVAFQSDVIWDKEMGGSLTLALVASYPNLSFGESSPALLRTIGLSWTYELPGGTCPVEQTEVWRGDYPTSEEWAAAVGENATWQWGAERPFSGSETISQDE